MKQYKDYVSERKIYMPFRVTLKLSLLFFLPLAFLREEEVEGVLLTQRSESLIGLIINQINEIYEARYSPLVTLTGNLHAQHFIQLFF